MVARPPVAIVLDRMKVEDLAAVRANQGHKICADDGDREMVLVTLSQDSKRTGWPTTWWPAGATRSSVSRVSGSSWMKPISPPSRFAGRGAGMGWGSGCCWRCSIWRGRGERTRPHSRSGRRICRHAGFTRSTASRSSAPGPATTAMTTRTL